MLPDGRIKLFSHVELGLYGETRRTLRPLCAGLDEKATLRPLSFFLATLRPLYAGLDEKASDSINTSAALAKGSLS